MCWIATVAALALIAHRYTRSPLVQAFAALLVVTNVTRLGNAGMLVTNNLMPVPFALFGLYFFLRGVDHADPDWRVLVLAGAFLALAIGFKANYVFVLPPFVFAALFVPTTVTFRRRLSRVLLPMLAGGLIGGAPTLRSEEHTSELQSLMRISYAVFCLKKKKKTNNEQYLKQTQH